MNKEEIERITLEVNVELGRPCVAHYLNTFATRFIERIDAERGKQVVAFRIVDGDDVEYNGIDQFSCGRAGGEPLFLSPTPTIPEGMALVPIEPTKEILEAYCHGLGPGSNWSYMIAAAQGERNAD